MKKTLSLPLMILFVEIRKPFVSLSSYIHNVSYHTRMKVKFENENDSLYLVQIKR